MPFPYVETTWATNDTITAAKLNQIEDQLTELSKGLQADFVLIAGGGGGYYSGTSGRAGGGGGGGGYIARINGENTGGGLTSKGPVVLQPGQSYTVTIGGGGSSFAAGSNSAFGDWISTGGGGTGTGSGEGGSGAGGYYLSSVGPPGTGLAGQGFDGGTAATNKAGGGGGAGAIGGNAATNAGNGGAGVTSSISGSSVGRGGGGGGGISSTTLGAAGTATDGGGAGGAGNVGNGTNGTANTGGGGGGAGNNGTARTPGNGGSGVLIIRYLGSQAASGGTVTTSGGYAIHTFTASGTFRVY